MTTVALLLVGILFGPAPEAEANLSSLDGPQGLAVLGDEVFTGFTAADNAFLTANGIASIPVATAPVAAGVTGVSISTAQAAGITGTAAAGVGMFGWLKGWLHIGGTTPGLSPGTGIPAGWDLPPAYRYISGWYGAIHSVDSVTVSADRHQATVVETIDHQPGTQQSGVWKMKIGCGSTLIGPGQEAPGYLGGLNTSRIGKPTGTLTTTYTCPAPDIVVDGIVGYSGLPAAAASTAQPPLVNYAPHWLPPYAPGVPPGVPAGSGTFRRSVTCSNGQTYTDSIPATVGQAADFELGPLNCPPGSVAVTFGSTWTAAGGTPQPVTPSTSTPIWVQRVPVLQPQCLVTTCHLQLFSTESSTEPVTCGDLAALCPQWYVSPTRAEDYQCHWGPYTVDLSACAVFRDPGRVLPNGTAGPDGTTVITEWPTLELDTDVVATLRSRLVHRYDNDHDTACQALGETVRADRSATALVSVPDIVEICRDYDLQQALQWIADSDTGDLAVTALVDASTNGDKLDNFTPDCDEINALGDCLEWFSEHADDQRVEPEPELEPAAAGAGGRVPPPGNCMSDLNDRNELLAGLPKQMHHMATWYTGNGAKFQNILDAWGLNLQVEGSANASAAWNLFEVAHRGRHPAEYHQWVMDNVENAAEQAGYGNTAEFLRLFNAWVVDVVKADPTILRLSYWKCHRR
ncbi:AHH domain-containing protein [Cellulomonas sp. URHB0016]